MYWFALGSPLRVYVEESAACAGWIFEDDFDCRFYLGLDDFGFGWIAEGKVEFICGGGYEPSDGVCQAWLSGTWFGDMTRRGTSCIS